jgi:hypothetical protein
MLQVVEDRIISSVAVRNGGRIRVDDCYSFGLKIRRFHGLLAWLCLSWALVACPGCGTGERRVPTYKASGQVLSAEGKAVANALLVLHPVDAKTTAPKPRATTDGEGRFQLTTYDTGDGAPDGEFIVTVEQWFRDDPNEAPTNHLPPALGRPDSSSIRISIAKTENSLEPIRLR